MKKNFPIYTLLLAIYPVIDLYSLLPGGIHIKALIRPTLVQIFVTIILMLLFYFRGNRNLLRAGFLTGFTVFYFSSTGYFYRSLPFQSIPAISHLAMVILGIFILLLLTHPLVWRKHLNTHRLQILTGYLNILALIVLIFPIYKISKVVIDASDDAKIPWSQIIIQNQSVKPLQAVDAPDIYYIILDGYGRQDAIEDVFGYSNDQFISKLEELGFYVANDTHSNYIRTVVSLSSSLNMDYINFAKETAGKYSINYLPLKELIQNNRARSLLEQANYTTIAVSSDYSFTDWKDANIYLYPFKNDLNELERFFYASSAIGAFYDPEFPFTKQFRSILPIPSYGTRRAKILFAFEQLKFIPDIETNPKFVFVHIIAPHPPFVFESNGDPTTIGRPYSPGDGEGYTGDFNEYKSMYVEQLKFTNSQILNSIQAILDNSSRPPVIIIQGDHGSGSLLKNSSIDDSCMYERASILSAYYMPDGKLDLLYPDITPVNSFRVIFNTYFDADFPILDDQVFYSPFVNPYDFVNITDQLEDKCQKP